jgi:hypothetical protein
MAEITGPVRIRVKKMLWVKTRDMLDNDGNWRLHPQAQKDALKGLLKDVGVAGVMMGYYSDRKGGKLTLIDGHGRKEIDEEENLDLEWPVVELDVNDEEADKILATHDFTTGMAEVDGLALETLIQRVKTDDLEVRELLRKMEMEAAKAFDEMEPEEEPDPLDEVIGPPDMELLPFEHYDYVMVVYRRSLDWAQAMELLNLEKKGDPRITKAAKHRSIGLCKVIDGAMLNRLILDGTKRTNAPDLNALKQAHQQGVKSKDAQGLPYQSTLLPERDDDLVYRGNLFFGNNSSDGALLPLPVEEGEEEEEEEEKEGQEG